MKKKQIGPAVEKAGLYVVGVISFLTALFLSLVSLLHTTVVAKVNEGEGVQSIVYHIKERVESVYYLNDNLIVNLLVLAFLLVACFALIKRLKIRLSTRMLGLLMFLWTFILGVVWVLSSQSAPTEDSGTVTSASWAFAENNYSCLRDIRYFHNYAFQLGYVLFNEWIIRFIQFFKHMDNLMPLEVLNAVFLGVINLFLVKIADKLFGDRRVTILAAILLALSTAPIISCSFVYGIYPGMMFAVIALYCEICFLKETDLKKGIFYAVPAALCITLAVMVKSNYMIWLVAMLLIAAAKMIGRKKFIRDGIFIVVTAVMALNVQSLVIRHYEKKAGVEITGTIPYTAWLAMGINESEDAPGWYNYGYTLGTIEQANFDEKVAAERISEILHERIDYLVKHPQYTNDFFYYKNVSQWNDTSYQSVWNNQVRGQYKEKNAFAAWVCGDGEATVKKLMDYFAQLIFFGFCIGCLAMIRSKNFMLTPLPVVFLGGFFYHMIGEGKSQYVLPYFIAMCAFAAYGIVQLGDWVGKRVSPAYYRLYWLIGTGKPQPAAEAAGTAAAETEAVETVTAETEAAAAEPPAEQPEKTEETAEKNAASEEENNDGA